MDSLHLVHGWSIPPSSFEGNSKRGHCLTHVGTEGQVRVGKRIWGAVRCIDVVLTHRDRRRLGLECKFQGTRGTAEEKIPATLQDLAAWPIPGIVVFDGAGFSGHMRSFLLASGKAIQLEDLEAWLRLFFGLELG